MIDPSSIPTCSSEQPDTSTAGGAARDQLMRVYLPDGAVRVMRFREYQEFLQSRGIEEVTPQEAENGFQKAPSLETSNLAFATRQGVAQNGP